MIRPPSCTFLCARLALSLFRSLSLHPGDTLAHPLPLRIPKQPIQAENLKIDKLRINLELQVLLLGILIFILAIANVFMMRLFYTISTQPWMSPVSRSDLLYQSIHWPVINLVIKTLHDPFEKGICYLNRHFTNFFSVKRRQPSCSAAQPSLSRSKHDPFHGIRTRSESDVSCTTSHHKILAQGNRATLKAFLVRTLNRFMNSKESLRLGDKVNVNPGFSMPSSLSMHTTTASTNACINSTATSHSPALSLGPSSGFYSLTEECPSTANALRSPQLDTQDPIFRSNETTHIGHSYSHGSPLETISEEFEELASQNQGEVSKRSSLLSDVNGPQDLRFIFFQPENSVKHLETLAVPGFESTQILSKVVSTVHSIPTQQMSRPMANVSAEYGNIAILTENGEFSKENFSSTIFQGTCIPSATSASTDSGSKATYHSTMSTPPSPLRPVNNERPATEISSIDVSIPTNIPKYHVTKDGKILPNISRSYEMDMHAVQTLVDSVFLGERSTLVNQDSRKKQEPASAGDLISIPSENIF